MNLKKLPEIGGVLIWISDSDSHISQWAHCQSLRHGTNFEAAQGRHSETCETVLI